MTRWVRIASLLLMLSGPSMAMAQTCAPDRVTLRGDWGTASFSVERAQTQAERNRGLMHRMHLPSGAGMLFIYPEENTRSFWMHNTFIALDMLFFDAEGRLQHRVSRAQPQDLSVHSAEGVQFVLEINGGLADALGVDGSTALQHPAIPQKNAVFPCFIEGAPGAEK